MLILIDTILFSVYRIYKFIPQCYVCPFEGVNCESFLSLLSTCDHLKIKCRDQFLFQDRFKFTILNAVLVSKRSDLTALIDAEARVMLLYCTREEAIDILTAAKDLKLTGENYVWVVTQSVIENPLQPPNQFPVGMLGKFFSFLGYQR